jgi:hypothetical protein
MLLIACVVLPCAAAANADPIIAITDTDDGSTAGTLTVTRTNNVRPGWDEIDLHFASWTVQYDGDGAPTYIYCVQGLWSGVGGNLGVSPLGGSDWVPRTTNSNSNTLLESFVNVNFTWEESYFVRGPGSAGSYASFGSGTFVGAEWYNATGMYLGPSDGPIQFGGGVAAEQSLLATIYVTSGGDVTFSGDFIFDDGYPHPQMAASNLVHVSFSTAVPEPSAFVLLGTGLIAAVICVWRKRR